MPLKTTEWLPVSLVQTLVVPCRELYPLASSVWFFFGELWEQLSLEIFSLLRLQERPFPSRVTQVKYRSSRVTLCSRRPKAGLALLRCCSGKVFEQCFAVAFGDVSCKQTIRKRFCVTASQVSPLPLESPCSPTIHPWQLRGWMPSLSPMRWRKRAESRLQPLPITRCLGKPLIFQAT